MATREKNIRRISTEKDELSEPIFKLQNMLSSRRFEGLTDDQRKSFKQAVDDLNQHLQPLQDLITEDGRDQDERRAAKEEGGAPNAEVGEVLGPNAPQLEKTNESGDGMTIENENTPKDTQSSTNT